MSAVVSLKAKSSPPKKSTQQKNPNTIKENPEFLDFSRFPLENAFLEENTIYSNSQWATRIEKWLSLLFG